ncbi:hypothetical protein D3C77_393820 [compost metagenome]
MVERLFTFVVVAVPIFATRPFTKISTPVLLFTGVVGDGVPVDGVDGIGVLGVVVPPPGLTGPPSVDALGVIALD